MIMMNHDELMEEWRLDCIIDQTQLMSTMSRHPMLHSKYLTHLQTYKIQHRKCMMKYQSMRVLRQRYYNGEMTKAMLDEQGWDQYLVKRPLKSELEALLDGSPEIQLQQEKSLYVESLVHAVESIMKDINSRYYMFTNLVAYEKFLAGS